MTKKEKKVTTHPSGGKRPGINREVLSADPSVAKLLDQREDYEQKLSAVVEKIDETQQNMLQLANMRQQLHGAIQALDMAVDNISPTVEDMCVPTLKER